MILFRDGLIASNLVIVVADLRLELVAEFDRYE